jgi:3-phytase
MKYIVFLIIILIFTSCNDSKKEIPKSESIELSSNELLILKPDVLSEWDNSDKIDSPAFYKDDSGTYVFATAKASDQIFVYNAENGNLIKKVGETGSELGQFKSPNGIYIYGDLCFIVERDNHRVQVLRLPKLEPVLSFGEDRLVKPYGLNVFRKDSKFHIYITDGYTENEELPVDSNLGKRVLHYSFDYDKKNLIHIEFLKYIGDTEGDGVLRYVESIYADPVNNNLLIGEEFEGEGNSCLKLYDLDGNFKKLIGVGLFKSQSEGIALIRCGKNGYWVATDQNKESSIFHFFDRKTFELVKSFKSTTLKNTDGISITQVSFDVNSQGALVASNNDGGIGIWNLGPLLFQLDIKCDNSTPDEADENTADAVRVINQIML